MNVYVTKKVGEKEISLSIEVNEDSEHAQGAFVYMNRLISNFLNGDEPMENTSEQNRLDKIDGIAVSYIEGGPYEDANAVSLGAMNKIAALSRPV